MAHGQACISLMRAGPRARADPLENAEALIVQDELAGDVEEIRADLSFPAGNYIHFGRRPCPAGYRDHEALLATASGGEPGRDVRPSDLWTLMYPSGTIGSPNGVARSNRSGALSSMVTEIELGIHRTDAALLVMPICHANSRNFLGAFSYCGAATTVYSRKSFDPEQASARLRRPMRPG
jgi:acyl-coenzyme A synthetase/AMP-(fatty) acid ligase